MKGDELIAAILTLAVIPPGGGARHPNEVVKRYKEVLKELRTDRADAELGEALVWALRETQRGQEKAEVHLRASDGSVADASQGC